ncbi:MAG: hypothetical protein LUD41_00790, partial [Phascolarctobacterium sp.]|nr:hypothetical protein [Phascolarctobacterium sp.]
MPRLWGIRLPQLRQHGRAPLCGWKDDAIAEDDPDSLGEGMKITLKQARKKWEAGKAKCHFCGSGDTSRQKRGKTHFFCNSCRKGFGSEPLLSTLYGEKPYPLMVKSFTFYFGDIKIKWKKKDDFILKSKNEGR